jgi:hypothetical protein
LMFLDHTQRHTTVGRTPLDEWSARRRHLYLKTHDTHNGYLFVCFFVCLFVRSFVYLFVCLFVCVCVGGSVSHLFTRISFNGLPSYGGDQTQRLATPVRKYVDLRNHQFRHPQHYASGHITVFPTQHCSLYILVQPNKTNAFYTFFMVRNSATVKIRLKNGFQSRQHTYGL